MLAHDERRGPRFRSDSGTWREALVCPACHGDLNTGADVLECSRCETDYPVADGVLRLLADAAGSDPDFYEADEARRYGRADEGMPPFWAAPVERFIDELPDDALLVEVGSGQGAFDACSPGYVATDYSFHALRAFSTGRRVQCDAQALPFRDGSVDAIFTLATLEHVPDPGRALAEIDRCLRPGGVALLFPAWYVRPWTARALTIRPSSELGLRDRIAKLTIPLRDGKLYQGLRVLPGRIARELTARPGTSRTLAYRRLEPNLSEYVTNDSDAYVSLDPHAVSSFFRSRGYEDLRRPGALARLAYAYEPVQVRKP